MSSSGLKLSKKVVSISPEGEAWRGVNLVGFEGRERKG